MEEEKEKRMTGWMDGRMKEGRKEGRKEGSVAAILVREGKSTATTNYNEM